MFDYVKDGYNKLVVIKVLFFGIYIVYVQFVISGFDIRYYEGWFLLIFVGFLENIEYYKLVFIKYLYQLFIQFMQCIIFINVIVFV